MTCHIPLANQTAEPRPLSEGRPPAAREGVMARNGQGSGRQTLTRLTPGSPLRPRRPVSPETQRPGPIGRHRPSPPGRFNILPAGRGSSGSRSVPGEAGRTEPRRQPEWVPGAVRGSGAWTEPGTWAVRPGPLGLALTWAGDGGAVAKATRRAGDARVEVPRATEQEATPLETPRNGGLRRAPTLR